MGTCTSKLCQWLKGLLHDIFINPVLIDAFFWYVLGCGIFCIYSPCSLDAYKSKDQHIVDCWLTAEGCPIMGFVCVCTCTHAHVKRLKCHKNHTYTCSYFYLYSFIQQILTRVYLCYKVQDVLPAIFPIKQQRHSTELMFFLFNKIVIDRMVFASFLSVVSESIFFQSIFSMPLLPHHLARCQIAVGSIQFCLPEQHYND